MSDSMIINQALAGARFAFVDGPQSEVPAGQIGIYPLATWLEAGEPAGVGVALAGDDEIIAHRDALLRAPVVALAFPVFTDGRCYSHARRLRAQWGYQGDLLAHGDVLRDQLVYMGRVGINAFYMRADQDLERSLESFMLFSEFYQYSG